MELTKEQQEDVAKRIEEFKKEYNLLTEKYKVDIGAYPQYFPSGNGGFITGLVVTQVDTKYRPIPVKKEELV